MLLLNRFPKIIRWILAVMVLLLLMMTAYRFFFFFHYRTGKRPFSGSVFLLGLRYDARIVAVLGLAMLLLCSIPVINPFKNNKAKAGWTIFLSILFLVFLVFYGADFYHYDYLKQRLNASVLNFLQDAGISANMMWQTYPLVKICIMLLLFVVSFAVWHKKLLSGLIRKTELQSNKRIKIISHILFILLLAVLTFGKLGQYPLRWSDAFAFGDDFKASASLNPFQSFFSSLKFRNSTYDIKKVKASYTLMAEYLNVQQPDSITLNYKRSIEFKDTFVNKPNIVIVICESFSAYKSSMFGNKLDPTPYFNTLCNDGVFFERCFTPAFGTARGVWATITGIPDIEYPNTASRNPSAVDQHSIINDFKTYQSFYFLGGSTTWANIRGLLTNNITGLSIYEEDNFKANKVDVWGISDKNLFLEANKVLSKQEKPFISIIQTADNHRPYTIPSEDANEFKKINYPADSLKKYGFDDNGQFNAFRYTDFCYQKFIEAAKKEKYFDNTIFVFVGDHGLRGDAGNMFPQSFTKQGILAEHVPLLFYAPKILQPKRVLNVCSQLDILPSVATIARQSYSNTTLGRNLFDSTPGPERFAFIADPDTRTIGLAGNTYYYSRNLNTGKKEFVSLLNNDPVPHNAGTGSIKNYMSDLSEAWYETAKYLLLNNKKKN